MRVLLDTNILLRLANRNVAPTLGPQLTGIVSAHELFVVPQCLYEGWTVMTRPLSANGLGLSPSQAHVEVQRALSFFKLLPDPSDLFPTWLDLVTIHQVSGKPSHDARLAAAVKVHQLDALLTLNAGDFKRFGLNVLTPTDL